MQQEAPNLNDRDNNNLSQHSRNPFILDDSLERIRPKNLEPESCNDERTSDSDFTIPHINEVDLLRMQLFEKDTIDRRLQRERE